MKVPPKGWAIFGGLAAIVLIGRLAMGCGGSDGFSIGPAQGTKIRLDTYSDSTIKISGVAARDTNLKMTLSQLLEFTSPPGPTQSIEITSDKDKCFVDGGQDVLPLDGVEDALKAFKVSMTIRPTGEPASVTPDMTGSFPPAAENVISSQVSSLQATGPMGYVFKKDTRPAVGESWTFEMDLMDAVRDSSRDYVTPSAATAKYTFTYIGDTTRDGIAVHHLKRVGEGRIVQKVSVEGMGDKESTTTMTSEGDVYVDASTGLLIYLESVDKAVIDFGAIKMNQTTKVTVKGSKAF
jgi:hypothetical protein